MHTQRLASIALLVAVSTAGTSMSGCSWQEGLIINNMQGTVVVPRAAATRTFVDENGDSFELTDVRNIGPIYVGVFPSVEPANVLNSYPHPEQGPVLPNGEEGDTFPYGGTTVGDIRFGCFDALTCKMTSGRFTDYQSIVDWFGDTLGSPILDDDGVEITDGEFFRQQCFDLLEVTSDEEVLLIPTDDTNGDDKLDELDLDFVENADGDFEATFTLWQQDYFWDINHAAENDCEPGLDCQGFSVWAFMDAPARSGGSFSTCEDGTYAGFEVEEYNHDFFGGRAYSNILNYPSSYIGQGDWISNQFMQDGAFVEGAYRWDNVYDRPVIRLGHEVL